MLCRVRVLLQGPAETREDTRSVDLLSFIIYLFIFPVGPSRETPGNLSQLFKGAIIQTPGDTEAAQIAFLRAVMRLRSVLAP